MGAVSNKLTRAEQAELLRRTVDTVGKAGQPGEKIRKVISVGMLSEGWDAKTMTHIIGLWAFSSQLLCEQVVRWGLRRTSYELNSETGRFDPEYTSIFSASPFTFLPHGSSRNGPPLPKPRTARAGPGRGEVRNPVARAPGEIRDILIGSGDFWVVLNV